MSVGYLNQEGLYATKDINFSRYNFRSNISAKISKYLTADAQLSGHVQDKMAPSKIPWHVQMQMFLAIEKNVRNYSMVFSP